MNESKVTLFFFTALLLALKHTANHSKTGAKVKTDTREDDTSCTTNIKAQSKYKCVQAAYSSMNVTGFDTNDNMKKTIRKTQSEDELKLFQSSCNKNDTSKWANKELITNQCNEWTGRLLKVAEKASTPKGEGMLRDKMKKYLNKIPSQFSDWDIRGKKFREKLPDNIIRQLKSIYSRSKYYSLSNTYFATAVKSCDKLKDFRVVLKNWFRKVKLRDDIYIDRDALCESLICIIKQYVKYRRYHHIVDFKYMLKGFLWKLLNYLPIDMQSCDKRTYLSLLADDLVRQLSRFYNSKRNTHVYNKVYNRQYINSYSKNYCCFYNNVNLNKNEYKNKPTLRQIKDFVTNEIIQCVEETKVQISKRRLITLKIALTELFINKVKSENVNGSSLSKEIDFNLQTICKLSKLQAKLYSRKMYCKFLDHFDAGAKISSESIVSDIYPIISNEHDVEEKPKIKKQHLDIDDNVGQRLTAHNQDYTKTIEKVIDKWLEDIDIKAPLIHQPSYRRMAISDLAREIIESERIRSRGKTLAGKEDTLDMRIRIMKWIIKIAGDDYLDIIGHTIDLVKKLKSVSSSIPETIEQIDKLKTKVGEEYTCMKSDLYEVVNNWFQDLPYELLSTSKETFIKQVTRGYTNVIENNINSKNIDKLLEKETDIWLRKILRKKPKQSKIEELKENIKQFYEIKSKNKNDVSMQAGAKLQEAAINTEFLEQLTANELCNSFDLYLKDVANAINLWLDNLEISGLRETKLKNVAVHDLAGDIVDRYKYLQLNPSYRGTYEDDLEYLKFQIFKSINNVLGIDNMQTMEHASELLEKITAISAPLVMKTKRDTKINKDTSIINSCANIPSPEVISERVVDRLIKSEKNEKEILRSDLVHNDAEINAERDKDYTPFGISQPQKNKLDDCKYDVTNQNLPNNNFDRTCSKWELSGKYNSLRDLLMIDSQYYQRCKIKDCQNKNVQINKLPTFGTKSCFQDHCNVNKPTFNPPIDRPIPEVVIDEQYKRPRGMIMNQTYRYFDMFFKQYCDELPWSSTPRGIYNGIWKIFFKLKSDPQIQNNIKLFDEMFEDRLDTMLDCLPQTEEFKQYRPAWKARVVEDASNMLKCIQKIQDKHELRQKSTKKFEREKDIVVTQTSTQKTKNTTKKGKQHCNCRNSASKIKSNLENTRTEVTDTYNQKHWNREKNPVEHFSVQKPPVIATATATHKDFLVHMPLNKEAAIANVIDQWYNTLPVKPIQNKVDEIARKKLRELLARKIHKIENEAFTDIIAGEEIRGVIVRFLAKDAELNDSAGVNFNDVIDDLMIKLESRRDAKAFNNNWNKSMNHITENNCATTVFWNDDVNNAYVTKGVMSNFAEKTYSVPNTVLRSGREAHSYQTSPKNEYFDGYYDLAEQDDANDADNEHEEDKRCHCCPERYIKYMKNRRSLGRGFYHNV